MDRVELTVEPGDERAFVFRYVADEGAVGIFVPTDAAPPVGTSVTVHIGALALSGVVAWRNGAGSDTAGAGVVLELSPLDGDGAESDPVDALLAVVRAIAYLPSGEEA